VTHTMKIKRSALEARYGGLAEEAFGGDVSAKDPGVIWEQ